MQKNNIKSIALTLGAIFVLSGCGSDSESASGETDPLELESDGKALLFYSASTNDHYAFEVDSQEVLNLNSATNSEGEDISNFNMAANEQGRLFIWIDNKGDANVSNDEGKVVMFKDTYSFSTDGNATWEDFYYLGHFHEEEENGETHYHLAAHSNDEFNVTSGGKFNAMIRLNTYLGEQDLLEQNLTATIPAAANGLCGFHTFESEDDETFYYAMGTNGTMYVYDENITTPALDSVAVTDSCSADEFGMSSTEDGVLFFSSVTQKVYAVDSHDDGIYHIHSSWDLSQLLGSGKSAQMMVGLEPVTD